jgi:hypothetical protein
MIKVHLSDGYGKGNRAKVNGEGELGVVVHPHPPADEIVTVLPFRQYFTTDGTSSGSNDMIVNGSTTAVDFYVEAVPEYDIYINSISVEIGDSGSPNLNSFGALSALTNGIEWIYFNQDQAEYQLHDGIKTNKEFIRLSNLRGAFGDGSSAFLADVSGGSSTKSYLPSIDISENFGMPWGLRLQKGTTDKLIFRVRDALAGLDVLNAIAYGIRQEHA